MAPPDGLLMRTRSMSRALRRTSFDTRRGLPTVALLTVVAFGCVDPVHAGGPPPRPQPELGTYEAWRDRGARPYTGILPWDHDPESLAARRQGVEQWWARFAGIGGIDAKGRHASRHHACVVRFAAVGSRHRRTGAAGRCLSGTAGATCGASRGVRLYL